MTRLSQDNDDLLIEIRNYKEIIQQLKATLDNYNKELVTKTTMLNNIISSICSTFILFKLRAIWSNDSTKIRCVYTTLFTILKFFYFKF